MENRFGIKDFFLFALMIGLLIAVFIAGFIFDRQYDEVIELKQQSSLLAKDLNSLKGQLDDLAANIESGVAVVQPGGNGAQGGGANASTVGHGRDGATDPFYLVKEAEQADDFARGGWFLDNFGTKLGRITPLVSSDVYQAWAELQVMESLAQRDPYTLEFTPKLARSWQISEDGLEMIFKLRRNAQFSDGEPVTANDVVFTFNWILNPDVQADRARAYLTKLDKVEALDDYTVKFTFKERYFQNFEQAAGTSIMAEHFYDQYSPTDFNEAVGLLFGSGPYMVDGTPGSWSPGNGLTLVRNPRYWGTPATFDRIVFSEIESEDTEAVRFRNGDLDIFRATPELYTELTEDADVMKMAQAHQHFSPYKGYNYIGWNELRSRGGGDPHPTIFADAKVRRAMTMLLDRERLNQEVFLGFGTIATGPFDPRGPQSDPAIKPWPYDVEQARTLLREAGWDDCDGDGVIENEQGKPFEFTLTYPGGSPTYEKVVLFMRDNFKLGGIKMNTERLDWPVLIRRLNAKDFDAITLAWSGSPESDPYQIFHSSQIEGAGDNRISYRSPELDALIDKARVTMDRDQRMELWKQVHAILHEDQPYTFLFNRPNLYLFNDRIKNIKDSGVGLNFEYLNGGTIPWYIPETEQRHTR